MKKKLALIIVLILVIVLVIGLTACDEDDEKEIISQVVIDKIYEPPYEYMATEVVIIFGVATTIPVKKSMPESYVVKIRVTYIDETTKTT